MTNKPVAAIRWMLLLVLTAFCLTACTPSDRDSLNGGISGSQEQDLTGRPDDETLVLGFSQLGSESSWRVGNSVSIQTAAEEAGIQLMFSNAEQKQENQIKAIRSFIAYQVDVIVFAPIVEDGWDNVLLEAKAAGIPVLLSDRAINTRDESLFAGMVGSDFHEEGRRAGQFVLNYFNSVSDGDRIPSDGVVRIVELTGTVGSSPMRGRAAGFREILEQDSRFEIVTSESGDFLRSMGKERMREILADLNSSQEAAASGSGQIDVLFSHNDGMTLGAIESLLDAGLEPGEDVIIVSVDGEQDAIDALKAGQINCVVECNPMIGELVMNLAQRLATGQPIPRVTYTSETVFVQSDNLDELPPRGY